MIFKDKCASRVLQRYPHTSLTLIFFGFIDKLINYTKIIEETIGKFLLHLFEQVSELPSLATIRPRTKSNVSEKVKDSYTIRNRNGMEIWRHSRLTLANICMCLRVLPSDILALRKVRRHQNFSWLKSLKYYYHQVPGRRYLVRYSPTGIPKSCCPTRSFPLPFFALFPLDSSPNVIYVLASCQSSLVISLLFDIQPALI